MRQLEQFVDDATRAIDHAHDQARRYDNVGPADTVMQIRRDLRELFRQAHQHGFDAGYAAAVLDETAGRQAAHSAAVHLRPTVELPDTES